MTLASAWPRALAPLGLMAAIFYFSDQPSVGPELPAWVRVAGHFTEYALLVAAWLWALAPALGRRAVAVAALISLAWAISDEWHQSFVAGRDSDPLDVLVDAAGIAAGLYLARRLTPRGPRAPDRRTGRRARGRPL